MLVLRVGKSSAPIELDCSFCKAILPAREPFPIIETVPIDPKNAVEFETICQGCYQALRDKAEQFKIPIEYDVEPPKNTRLVVGEVKVRND